MLSSEETLGYMYNHDDDIIREHRPVILEIIVNLLI